MTNTQKIIKIAAICLAIIFILSIFSIIFFLLINLTNINFYNNKEKTTFTETYNDIRKIEIDAVSSSITIEEGTDFKVRAIDVNKRFNSNFKNKVLKIEENSSWFKLNKGNGKIIITIPTNVILEELSIDTGAGKFIVDGIEVKEFDINHGAGLLEISNSKFYETDINGGAGKITVTNSILNNLDLDSGVGKTELEAQITGKSEINCGVGELAITLLGKEQDYSIKTEKGIGSIKINNINQPNSTIYGNGVNKLKIEGGIGSINIDFK